MKSIEQKRIAAIKHKIDKQLNVLVELKNKSLKQFLTYNDIVKINNKFQTRLLNFLEEEKRNINCLEETNKLTNIENNISFIETFVD